MDCDVELSGNEIRIKDEEAAKRQKATTICIFLPRTGKKVSTSR